MPSDPPPEFHWHPEHFNYKPPTPPKFIIEELTGIKHRVLGFHIDGDIVDFRVLQVACGKKVVLGGKRHPSPTKCKDEK